MKLSNNFAALLREAYEEYNSPTLDFTEVWKPGLRYSNKMFLLEEKDLQKAINVYSHKRFAEPKMVDALWKATQSLSSIDIQNQAEYREFFVEHYGTVLPPLEFVADIWQNCSYGRKESGRNLLEELLTEYWYSQTDYKQIRDTAGKVTALCEFWVHQNRLGETYAELLAL